MLFSLLITAFVRTAISFGCFSAAVMVARCQEYLYLAGLLSSGVSILFWLHFASSIFGGSTSLFKFEILVCLVQFMRIAYLIGYGNEIERSPVNIASRSMLPWPKPSVWPSVPTEVLDKEKQKYLELTKGAADNYHRSWWRRHVVVLDGEIAPVCFRRGNFDQAAKSYEKGEVMYKVNATPENWMIAGRKRG
ncbi:Trafficking protein particle complex II-specific subunit 130 homolog [Linum perenne]